MSKKPSLNHKYNLSKQAVESDPTQKNAFRDDEAQHVVQMNARVTPELKERVRIHCAIADLICQSYSRSVELLLRSLSAAIGQVL